MNPNKPKNHITRLAGFYQDLQPDAGAIHRMRSRLEAERMITETDPVALVSMVFKRYVLAAAMVLLVLSVTLDLGLNRSASEPDITLDQWLYAGTDLNPVDEISEYTLLMEF